MRIVIAGGSGFLGRALHARLSTRGDEVRVLTRSPTSADDIGWNPSDPTGAWTTAVATADAVVNLAGAPVDRGRWTTARKRSLVDSRLLSTQALVKAIGPVPSEAVFINASAVGFYGNRGDEVVTEDSSGGSDFLATLCQRWEGEARNVIGLRRLVLLRTGLVLDARHGALGTLLTPFRLGVGGPVGDGRQYWSWIHRDDWVNLTIAAIDDRRFEGALNLVAPQPVTNRTFAKALGRVLRRPAIMPAPAFALRLVLGEMADAMVLGGQRVSPAKAQSLAFRFGYSNLDAALRDLLASP